MPSRWAQPAIPFELSSAGDRVDAPGHIGPRLTPLHHYSDSPNAECPPGWPGARNSMSA
jgi:hypothetical protein